MIVATHSLLADQPMKLIPSHPLAKTLPSAVEVAANGDGVHASGARGEVVSAQVVVRAGSGGSTVTAELSDLKSVDRESSIPSSCAHLQWVRAVDITTNTQDIPSDDLIGTAPLSIPDPFFEDEAVWVDAGTTQSLWIEVEVPRDAAPGLHKGVLTVESAAGKCTLPMELRVWDFVFPEERHQKVMQWWDFPGRGFTNLKPNDEQYWKLLERSCQFLRRYRQTEVYLPWSIIDRATTGTGTGAWNTSVFERYADTAFECGLRAVHFASLAHHTKGQTEPDSRTDISSGNLDQLAAVQKVVERRGWKGRVFTSVADEPFIYQETSYAAVLRRMREVAPSVGVVEAVETEQLPELDIYVPKLSHLNLWFPYFDALKRQGREVWFYTCCFPRGRYPNRFIDQPLIKARELHWISYLYGLDGFLHWGLNWFSPDGDPYSETGRNPWGLPPGDSQVAYPGRNGLLGSLRLCAMRDGLQDYEYLWTLEQGMRQLKEKHGPEAAWLDPRQRSLELCRRVVQSLYDHTRDPQVLFDTRAAIAREIEDLSADPLLVVQTTPADGSVTPEGPIWVNIRGITTPGAHVSVNGRPVIAQNVSPGGCFMHTLQISKQTPTITISAEHNGTTRTVTRSFKVTE